MNALKQLEQAGQALWLDYVHRSLFATGDIALMIERDGLKGMTSNPSIFQKAIGESDEYESDLKAFLAQGDHAVMALYEHLAIADIQAAADALRPVFQRTEGADGYISLEVSPYLAHDTEATVAEARRLWATVDRPNLMVKVPATPAGIPAIRALIGQGLNVNVTLLFAVEMYAKVHDSWLSGLEDWAESGGDLRRSASVASFFVSRIDTMVDQTLDERVAAGALDPDCAAALRGQAAIANARIAYGRYKTLLASPRWQSLAARGARPQRLLWASTSMKNEAYKDTLYVESLIGRDTVNTMPLVTMDAFRDHGVVQADTVEQDIPAAHAMMHALEAAGVSMRRVTDTVLEDGVRLFTESFDQLLSAVARRRVALLKGGATPCSPLRLSFGDEALAQRAADLSEQWRRDGAIRRLWAGDSGLWTGQDEAHWLGWLGCVEDPRALLPALQRFADHVKTMGVKTVLLLGMGGSSLGPDVLARCFDPQEGFPRLHILDSTDPDQVRAAETAAGDWKTVLVIVSSKSGNTLEPNLFLAYVLDRVTAAGGSARQCVAVTDPGSALDQQARALGFGHIFHGVPSIGGRYSVLSPFGLVPAAAMGLDVARLLDTTRPMIDICGPDAPPAENPGVRLGLALGAAVLAGRDKMTILAAPSLRPLGAWLEQLIAESTGKQGKGLIPIDAEPPMDAAQYGPDRFFVCLEQPDDPDPARERRAAALEAAGHPIARITVPESYALGREFFRWEIAIAVAGSVLGINPFDQPDVEASKIKTQALMAAYEQTDHLPDETPILHQDGIRVFAAPAYAASLGPADTLTTLLRAHLRRIEAGDYVALLAYTARNDAHEALLSSLRARIARATHAATCLGFGPRFLHSTGQAYKGGPNTGVFIQITADDAHDLPIPGKSYTFGVVKAAQAKGDEEVLRERGRRVIRVHLDEVESGLARLRAALGACWAD